MTEAVALREASTIMVLRDGANGIEVLMLRRNLSSGWVGGMHLFPGGAVDAEDRAPAMAELCRGFDDQEASRLLGTRDGGLGYFVAAVRECFEEAGVLLASPAGSPSAVSFVDPAVERRFIEHRRLLNKGEAAFSSICQREGLQLDLARLGYISHWITPAGSPRRYDTRFLVARMPPGQEALHDDVEVIDSAWLEPADALSRHERGEIEMMFPTVHNLRSIGAFGRVEEVLEATASSEVPAIEPRLTIAGKEVRILMPGEAGYEEATGLPEGTPFPDDSRRRRNADA